MSRALAVFFVLIGSSAFRVELSDVEGHLEVEAQAEAVVGAGLTNQGDVKAEMGANRSAQAEAEAEAASTNQHVVKAETEADRSSPSLEAAGALAETATPELWVLEDELWKEPRAVSLRHVRAAIRRTVGLSSSDALTLNVIDRQLKGWVEFFAENDEEELDFQDHRGCVAFQGAIAEVCGSDASNFKVTRSEAPHRTPNSRSVSGYPHCTFAMEVPDLSAAIRIHRVILTSDAHARLVEEEVNERLQDGPFIRAFRFTHVNDVAVLMRLRLNATTSDEDAARAVWDLGQDTARGDILREQLKAAIAEELPPRRGGDEEYEAWTMIGPRAEVASSFGIHQTASVMIPSSARPLTQRPAVLAVVAALAAVAAAAAP